MFSRFSGKLESFSELFKRLHKNVLTFFAFENEKILRRKKKTLIINKTHFSSRNPVFLFQVIGIVKQYLKTVWKKWMTPVMESTTCGLVNRIALSTMSYATHHSFCTILQVMGNFTKSNELQQQKWLLFFRLFFKKNRFRESTTISKPRESNRN